ncbi:MAG TPA: MarR family transcriptional regulator [Candidatus Nanopelagicaceae bacterium]|nr:MarR family transcriptional regulator [Candidatus Nanopelagicaceae bacterium]
MRSEEVPLAPKLSVSMGFRLSRIARMRRLAWSSTLQVLELTPPQASVLRGVSDAPATSLRSLARTLGTDAMTTKRCIDELERRGLLTSTSSATDRRPRLLQLTEPGRELVTKVHIYVEQQEAELRALFSADEFGQFVVLLDRLERGLGIDVHDSREKKESSS